MPTLKRKTKAQLEREFVRTKKLWKLLAMALDDLAACERSSKFEINMATFIKENGKCQVCLAGACLVRHGVTQKDFYDNDNDEDTEIQRRAYALDELRTGHVECALESIGSDARNDLNRKIIDYHISRRLWWIQMRLLLKDLRAANI